LRFVVLCVFGLSNQHGIRKAFNVRMG
jgi:hypothetical protein